MRMESALMMVMIEEEEEESDLAGPVSRIR